VYGRVCAGEPRLAPAQPVMPLVTPVRELPR
jgi:hypothetical protein